MSNSILNNEEVEALLSAIEGGQVLVGAKSRTRKRGKRFNTMILDAPIDFPENKNAGCKRLVRR